MEYTVISNIEDEEAINFLRRNGVEIVFQPIALMTPRWVSSNKYIYGEEVEDENVNTNIKEELSLYEAVDRVNRQLIYSKQMNMEYDIPSQVDLAHLKEFEIN